MVGRIVGCMCSILCGLPFLYISVYEKNSNDPISFWTGDDSLKFKLINIKEYNMKMSKLYGNYSISYFISGISFIFSPIIGVILVCMSCSLGIFIVHKYYKKYLDLYS